MRHQRIVAAVQLHGLKAAQDYFSRCFAYSGLDRETLWVTHLDAQLRLLHLSRNDGDDAHVDLPLKGIIVDAVRHGSVAIILAHNHPSGDNRPSRSDCEATRRLALVAEALDCSLLDHLIFGGEDKWTSFRQMGLL